MQRTRQKAADMDSLTTILFDPRRLAELGPTEEEVLADLTWPASSEASE
jgi:hypothetical protein